jgi:hypothetical protein
MLYIGLSIKNLKKEINQNRIGVGKGASKDRAGGVQARILKKEYQKPRPKFVKRLWLLSLRIPSLP